jgi:hypothetical protein
MKTLVQQLRDTAEGLRKEAQTQKETKLLKVAKVLSAARALNDLRAMMLEGK